MSRKGVSRIESYEGRGVKYDPPRAEMPTGNGEAVSRRFVPFTAYLTYKKVFDFFAPLPIIDITFVSLGEGL